MGILKSGSLLFGGQGSCLTLSNLGAATFPKELRPSVERVTPRKNAPYNCGVTSYNGKPYIGFPRRGAFPELEKLFFQRLGEIGFETSIEIDGAPVSRRT